MELIFVIIFIIYILMLIVIFSSAVRKIKSNPLTEYPSVSVIVAARNEEKNILSCIKSLDKIDYPEDKIEIIIVDDKSTDSTYNIVQEFIKEKNKFVLIQSGREIGHLKGKTNALANALEIAKGEIIFTTDADCIVPPSWVKTLVSYYDEETAAVFGITYIEGEKPFYAMQAVDSVYLLTVSSGSMNLNMPMSCIGNNMSYRRKVYDEVGGYESFSFSITEDYRLLKEIVKLKKYKVVYPVDKNALIKTLPCEDYKTLYRQRKRWSVGGLETIWQGLMLMLFGYLGNLATLLATFFMTPVIAVFLAGRFIADYIGLKIIHNKLGLKFKIKDLLVFEMYYIIYAFMVPIILSISREVIWKDKKYEK